jgi:hypothetical protein
MVRPDFFCCVVLVLLRAVWVCALASGLREEENLFMLYNRSPVFKRRPLRPSQVDLLPQYHHNRASWILLPNLRFVVDDLAIKHKLPTKRPIWTPNGMQTALRVGNIMKDTGLEWKSQYKLA